MNIFDLLKKDLTATVKTIYSDQEVLRLLNVEIPKDSLNGDLSTNIAMVIAARQGGNPKEIALKLKELLLGIPYIAHIEVAGPGFINFTIKAENWHECITKILSDDQHFKEINVGNNKTVNIEYVSANATGPMHIGHARVAVYGDALANLLSKCGYQVTKEYYINDAGAQIDNLTKTVMLRYRAIISGQAVIIPEGFYPGEYLIEVSQKIFAQFGDKLLQMPEADSHQLVKQIAVDEMMIIIKQDLKDLGIHHQIFFSEQSLHDSGKITEVIKILTDMDLIYLGQIPEPKGKQDDHWQSRTQALFRSTAAGDEQDRPVQKADGTWSYLAADLAYAKDKIDRGYDSLIFVLGADHSGYVKRIKAVVKALSNSQVSCQVKICQVVNFVENDIPIKMSKRSGRFTTVKDVLNEVGSDIIRFIMLTRKNDAPLNFDLTKVKEQSKDNPVFYVQYAYVRTVSILSNGLEHAEAAYHKFTNQEFDLSLLSSEEEIQLIKLLASWPKVLEGAAIYFEPHRIAFYLLSVAAKFHSLWNLGKENNDYRFIISDNIELTSARLALAKSVQKIIMRGFEIIGITPMARM